MKCCECKDKISLYIDQMLTQEENESMEAHLRTCEKCNEEYKQTFEIVKVLKQKEVVELPQNFHNELMSRLKEERQINTSQKLIYMRKYNYKTLLPIVAVLLTGFILFSNHRAINFNKEISYSDEEINMASLNEADSVNDDIVNQEFRMATTRNIDEQGLANEDLIEEVYNNKWYIKTNDEELFLEQIKTYLDEKKWTYVIDDTSIRIEDAKYHELSKWLKALEVVEKIDTEGDETLPIIIIYNK